MADRLALFGARVPAHLLGRRDDARAGDRAGGRRRPGAATSHRLPRLRRDAARRCRRRARVPGRDRRRSATASRRSGRAARRPAATSTGSRRSSSRSSPPSSAPATATSWASLAGSGDPLAGNPPASPGLDDVILRRGSDANDGSRRPSVSRELYEWSLAASLRGSRVPHFVAVHAVDGVEPGLYRWPDLDTPLRAGNLREELFRVCLDQELGRDAIVRRHRRRRPRRPSTIAATARPSSAPGSSRAGCISRPTRSASAPPA